MKPFMLPALCALALVAHAADWTLAARRDAARDPASEPPLRAALTVGEERVVLDVGRPGALADGTPVAVELLATRVFDFGAPFTFEYPREWLYLGGADDTWAWWSLGGEGVHVTVRRISGDPATEVAAFVRSAQGGTAQDIQPVERELDGRPVTGERCRARGFSVHGGPGGDWLIECLGVRDADGRTWLVALQRQLPEARSPSGFEAPRLDGGIVHLTGLPQQEDPCAPIVAAVLASWRWRR